MCDVNLTERLAPYCRPNPDDVNAMMLDLRLRLIAAICDRPGMDPTVKADNVAVTLVGDHGFETTLRADVTCKLMPCEGCDEDCPMRGGV